MKYAALLTVALLARLPGVSQTLFFDKMANGPWAIKNFTGVGALAQAPEIQLYATIDSMKTAACFFGSRLLICGYNPQLGRVVMLTSYAYRADRDHGTLTIFFADQPAVTYDLGITSTGTFAVLSRKRRQPKAAG